MSGARLLAAVLLLGACARGRATADAAPPGGPALAGMSPDTVPIAQLAVPTLTLRGTGFVPGGTEGFADGGNTVHVGTRRFDRVAADAEGRTIRLAVPLEAPDTLSRGQPRRLGPGRYPVSVSTPVGTSNVLWLTFVR
jgi:hypothetical protein